MATPPTMYDGFTELRHGQNASRNPMLLPETQCARAINVQFRGGCARTRPGWTKVPVDLPSGEFQGCGWWGTGGDGHLVFVVAGTVYTLDLETLEILNHGYRLWIGRQCEFIAANRFIIIRDGASIPVALEHRNGEIRRRPTSGQWLPRGFVGVFAHGRYHLVPAVVPSTGESGRAYILSGDIQEIGRPTTLLRFSETTYLAEGGANALPLEMGDIGAMGVFRNAPTGTGYGHVLVLGENGVCGFDFSLPREMWKQQPISQVLYFGSGCNSPWSVVNVNNDLMYRAEDGIRMLGFTHGQAQGGGGSMANVPVSLEVEPFLDLEDPRTGWISAALADNRAFVTVNAQDPPSGSAYEQADIKGHEPSFYKGLAVLDLGAGYYSGAEGLGAYDGLWTGLDIFKIESAPYDGRKTLFAFTTEPALYRLDDTVIADACTTPIQSRIETKAFAFGDLVSAKHLQYVEVWVTDIQATTEIKVWYRPHGYQLWKALGTRTITVPDGSLPHSHRRFRFSLDYSDSNCDPTSGEPLWVATGFQFAVQWTGNMVLERVRGAAQVVGEAPPPPCDWAGQSLAESDAAGEVLNDYDYDIDCVVEHDIYDLGLVWPEDEYLDPGIDPQVEYTFDVEVDVPDGAPGGGGGTALPEPGWPTMPGYPDWPIPDENWSPDEGEEGWEEMRVYTNAETSLISTGMTLNGTLHLGSTANAYVYFTYKKASDFGWNSTSTIFMESSGAFSYPLTGLTPSTPDNEVEYLFIAVVIGEGFERMGRQVRVTMPQELYLTDNFRYDHATHQLQIYQEGEWTMITGGQAEPL